MQRLAHAIGKSRTMEIVLTGRNFSAQEAADWGMVSRVVPAEEGSVVDAAVKMAAVIASKSQIAVQAGKEVVNAAYEQSLQEGLRYERRVFHSLFATKDQKEGECCPFGFLCVWTLGLGADGERDRYVRVRGEEEADLDALVRNLAKTSSLGNLWAMLVPRNNMYLYMLTMYRKDENWIVVGCDRLV